MEKENIKTNIEKIIKQTNIFRNRLASNVPISYFHNVLKLLFELKRLKKSSLFYFDPVDYEIISVQRGKIPEDSVLVECYENKDAFLIFGHPNAVPNHDCLGMGCFDGKHIIYKFKK